MLLPSVVVLQYGLESSSKEALKLKKGISLFFWAVFCLYLSYLAIIGAYWYFLELRAETLDLIMVNPVFIWICLGFFVVLEQRLFKKEINEEQESVTIFSNRKKTILKVSQIIFVESRGDFTLVHMDNGDIFRNNVKISQWQNRLDGFLRIHRSFLINPVKATIHGSLIRTSSNTDLPISRGYKKTVVDYFAT